jgi:hypothetical protein
MTDPNPYVPQGYSTFSQRIAAQKRAAEDASFFRRITSRIGAPVFATAALLVTAAAVAGIFMVWAAPGGMESDPPQPVPVIQAESGDIMAEPDRAPVETASMPMTADSSVLMAGAAPAPEAPPVENLLDQEKPMDKLEAFAKQAEKTYAEKPAAEITEAVDEIKTTEVKTAEAVPVPAETIAAAPAQKIHPAGTNPDTIAFVKSVLDEKDGKSGVDETAVQAVEPAAGAASPAIATPKQAEKIVTTKTPVVSGNYYIQLGSVPTEPGAAMEWRRLQAQFASTLSGKSYRVQSADLGPKGTMYRIQAGPMKRDDALNACTAIKASKPGGCIVVQ